MSSLKKIFNICEDRVTGIKQLEEPTRKTSGEDTQSTLKILERRKNGFKWKKKKKPGQSLETSGDNTQIHTREGEVYTTAELGATVAYNKINLYPRNVREMSELIELISSFKLNSTTVIPPRIRLSWLREYLSLFTVHFCLCLSFSWYVTVFVSNLTTSTPCSSSLLTTGGVLRCFSVPS